MVYAIGNSVLDNWTITQCIKKSQFSVTYEIQKNQYGINMISLLEVISVPKNRRDIVEKMTRDVSTIKDIDYNSYILNYDDYKVIPYQDSFDFLIRMEKIEPLSQFLKSNSLSENEIIELIKNIIAAIKLASKNNVIHTDISLDNIYITPDKQFKLGGFGIAKNIRGIDDKVFFPFTAPEVINGTYDIRADFYSLGLVVYALLNNNLLPFEHRNIRRAYEKRLNGNTFNIPLYGSEHLKNLVMKLCSYLPGERYSDAKYILWELDQIPRCSDWVTNIKEENETEVYESQPADINKAGGLNVYSLMISSHENLVKQNKIDKESAEKEIRIFEFLESCNVDDLCRLVDSGAFNDIIRALMRYAVESTDLDQESKQKVNNQLLSIFETISSRDILLGN